MDEQQLLRLKQQIDTAKSITAELTGREKQLMEQLESEYGCKTVKQAEQKLEKLQGEIAQLDKQIAEGVKELEESLKNPSKDQVKEFLQGYNHNKGFR